MLEEGNLLIILVQVQQATIRLLNGAHGEIAVSRRKRLVKMEKVIDLAMLSILNLIHDEYKKPKEVK